MTHKPISRLDHLRADLARAEAKLNAALRHNPPYSGSLTQDHLRALRLLKDAESRSAKGWPDHARPGDGSQP